MLSYWVQVCLPEYLRTMDGTVHWTWREMMAISLQIFSRDPYWSFHCESIPPLSITCILIPWRTVEWLWRGALRSTERRSMKSCFHSGLPHSRRVIGSVLGKSGWFWGNIVFCSPLHSNKKEREESHEWKPYINYLVGKGKATELFQAGSIITRSCPMGAGTTGLYRVSSRRYLKKTLLRSQRERLPFT